MTKDEDILMINKTISNIFENCFKRTESISISKKGYLAFDYKLTMGSNSCIKSKKLQLLKRKL